MEASNWEELDFMLKAAGIPTDKLMGIEIDSEDESEDDAVPSPRTFHENLKMTVKGEELKFPFLDLREFELYGTRDLQDELITPPPFMDVGPLLQPVSIPSEDMEEMRQTLAQMLEAAKKEEESRKSTVQVSNVEEQQPPMPSKEDSPEISASSARDLGRAKKRQRGSEDSDDSDVMTPPIALPTTSPTIPDDSPVIISSGSSTELMEQDSDATDVIDLTQQL